MTTEVPVTSPPVADRTLLDLLETQRVLLEQVVAGASSADVLDNLCLAIERLVPDTICSIMRPAGDVLEMVAAPSVPEDLATLVTGVPVGQGSCGAAYATGEMAIVTDTATDPRWASLQDTATATGIRSCWSIPIRSRGDQLLGTFAISRLEVSAPRPEHVTMLETAAAIAAITFQRAEEAAAHVHAGTAEARHREELLATEAKWQTIAESVPDFIMLTELDGTIRYINRTTTDLDRDAVIGTPTFDHFEEKYHDLVRACFDRVAATGRPDRYSLEYVAADGERRVFETRVAPVMHDGRVIALAQVSSDMTDHLRIEEALRQSTERFLQIAETIDDVFWLTECPDDRVCYVSPAFEHIWGRSCRSLYDNPQAWMQAIHPDDRARVAAAFHEMSERGELDVEYRILRPDGELRWIHDRGFPVRDGTGDTGRLAGIASDITARKRSEQELMRRTQTENLLLRELDHRVRNNLSSLITLIDVTRRGAGDVDAFAQAIGGRVHAMATVHSLLSRSSWAAIELDAMLDSLVPPDAPGRVRGDGPRLDVPASQASSLAMVLHELIVNSQKYGALGLPAGEVDVHWTATTDETGRQHIELAWRERGGPVIERGPEPGVGMSLVEGLVRSDLRGAATMTFPPTGVRHLLRMSLGDGKA